MSGTLTHPVDVLILCTSTGLFLDNGTSVAPSLWTSRETLQLADESLSTAPYISCFGPPLSSEFFVCGHIPLESVFSLTGYIAGYFAPHPYYSLGGPLTDLLPYGVCRYRPVVDKAVLLFHFLAIALAE